MSNQAALNCGTCSWDGISYTCSNSGSTFTPTGTSERLLRVSFTDAGQWKTISPDTTIRSVPYAGYALSALKLGTNVASDFVLKTGIPTCAANEFLSWSGSALSCSTISGSAVTNINASQLSSGTVPVARLPVGSTSGTIAAGDDARFTDSRPPNGSAAGDLSGSYPNPSVVKVNGYAFANSAPLDGQVYRYNNGNSRFEPVYFGIDDLKTSLGASQFASSCTASQTLTWSAVTDAFACSNIAGLDAAVISSGTISAARLPNDSVIVRSTSYTVTSSDSVVIVNASGGAVTMTLPSAVGLSGKQFTIKKTDSSANAVIIATTSAQTIDGAVSQNLSAQYQYLRVVSDGSNWIIVSGNISAGGGGGFGSSQTWQNVTGSRSMGTNYTNSTGKAIVVSFLGYTGGAGGGYLYATIDGVNVAFGNWFTSGGSYPFGATVVIPAGATYSINWSISAGSPSYGAWVELR